MAERRCWALAVGSALAPSPAVFCLDAGFSSPRHQAKRLFLPCIKRLQGLASALRLLLAGLVKRLRTAQPREVNLLHLSSHNGEQASKEEENLCFVACVRVWSR